MEHEELKNSIAAYCLGALDEAERQAVERHLKAGCDECQRLLTEMLEVPNLLSFAVEPQYPPRKLKERILAQIQPGKAGVPSAAEKAIDRIDEAAYRALQKSRRRWMGASAALAFALVIVIFLFSRESVIVKKNLKALESQLQFNEQVVTQLQMELEHRQQMIHVFQSEAVKLVDLKGSGPTPQASGSVYWDPENDKAVFCAFNLPPPPADKDYQLWMIRGSEPIDAGVFSIDEHGKGVSLFNTIPEDRELSAFAVTLEPKGGLPKPSGEIHLIGTI
jgi:anti-sigma-K factor RskA